MAITIQNVRDILPSDGDGVTDPQIQAGIDSAAVMMEDVIAGCGSNFSETKVDRISTYLAAHFIAVANPQISVVEEKFEGMSLRYPGFSGGSSQVMGTQYGRNANLLSGGCLAELEKTPASILSIGGC